LFRSESTKLSSLDQEEEEEEEERHAPHFHLSTHTLQLTRKKPATAKQAYNSLQRHSSANIESMDPIANSAGVDNSGFGRTGGGTGGYQRGSGGLNNNNNNNNGGGDGFSRGSGGGRRHGSNNNLDYDNVEGCGGGRSSRNRDRNLGDGLGKL
jgi:hypothetical protein